MTASRTGCAIVLGLPATRDAFCNNEHPSDYAVNQFNVTPENAWEGYRSSVALAEQLAETAARLGFTVYRRGDLDVIREATAAHGTVVLFGHTRSRGFVYRDFDQPGKLAKIRDQLCRPDIPFAALLNPFGTMAYSDARVLCDALNAAIADRSLLRALPPDERPMTGGDCLLEQMLCREMVDAALGTLIVPGNQLELFGTLHDLSTIGSAIDQDFCGEIALIACNSAVLATAIELRFGLDARLASWEIELLPNAYYVIVEIALRRWAEERGSLLDILRQLEATLAELAVEDRET